MQRVRGALFSITAITVVTACVYALRPVAPVLSLGGLYLFAVLPVSVLFGLAYAIPVAVASQLVFNFLFLPPLHTLALRDTENWVALAVYLVTAVVVSQLAAALVAAERVRRSDAIKTAVLQSVSATTSELRSHRSPAAVDGLESSELALDAEDRAGAARDDSPRGVDRLDPARRQPARSLSPAGRSSSTASRALARRRKLVTRAVAPTTHDSGRIVILELPSASLPPASTTSRSSACSPT